MSNSKLAEMNIPISSDSDSGTLKQFGEDEKPQELDSIRNSSSEPTLDTPEEPELLTGYALNLLVAGISLAGFIYSLDISIIVTVS